MAPAVLCLASAGLAAAGDCDGNGIEDEGEVRPVHFGFRNGFRAIDHLSAIAAADVDGDGDTDIAAISWLEKELHFLENEGGGILGRADDQTEDFSFADIEPAGDLNGDGEEEVLAIRSNDSALVVLSDSRGAEHLAGMGVTCATAADLDADGDIDVAAGVASPGFIVLRNDGDLGLVPLAPQDLSATPVDVAAADLDLDSDPDLAFATAFGVEVALVEAGLVAGDPEVVRMSADPIALSAGDMDGDGDADIVTANIGFELTPEDPGSASILLNDARGGMSPPRNFFAGEVRSRALELADLDDDGDLDAAVPNRTQGLIRMLLNDGRGIFVDERLFPVHGEPSDIALGDMQGDGRLDICIADSATDSILYLLDEGSGSHRFFPRPTPSPLPVELGENTQPNSIVPSDLDGDGDIDLAAAHAGGIAFLSNEDGAFSVAKVLAVGDPAVSGSPTRVLADDMDSDGDPDLVCSGFTGKWVRVLRNDGGLVFDEGPAAILPRHPSCLAAADLDGDGDTDIAAGTYEVMGEPAAGAILRNGGKGLLTVDSSFATAGQPQGVAAADLEGDGDMDLVFASYLGSSLAVHRNQGGAAFLPDMPMSPLAAPLSVIAADLDGDGDPDIAAPESTGSAVSFFSNEMGSFRGRTIPLREATPRQATAADFDGDGQLDIALSDEHSAGCHVLYGPALLWRHETFRTGSAEAIAAADFDGDGDADIALTLAPSGQVTVHWNQTEPAPGRDENRNGVLDACEAFRRGDANADRKLDIADAILVLRVLFQGGDTLPCLEAADVGNDGTVDISDPISLLGHLFLGDEPPAPPHAACGLDSDPPGSEGDLGCAGYTECP